VAVLRAWEAGTPGLEWARRRAAVTCVAKGATATEADAARAAATSLVGGCAIHAAGLPTAGRYRSFEARSEGAGELLRVFEPKALGAENLMALPNLRGLLVFSSTAALLGLFGGAGYAAGNSFAETLAVAG